MLVSPPDLLPLLIWFKSLSLPSVQPFIWQEQVTAEGGVVTRRSLCPFQSRLRHTDLHRQQTLSCISAISQAAFIHPTHYLICNLCFISIPVQLFNGQATKEPGWWTSFYGCSFSLVNFSFKLFLGFICPFSMATSKDQRSERKKKGRIHLI